MVNLILRINEFKAELAQCVNSAANDGVPFAVIEPIMQDVFMQIQSAARTELDRAQSAYMSNKKDEENAGA